MKKINLKNYIVLFISTAIATFAIYLDNNIYNASFDQYIYSLIKVSGMNGTKVVSVVLIILYGFLLFSLLSAIFILPTINLGRKVSINVKKNKENREVVILPIKNIKRYSRILLALSIIYLGMTVGFFDYAFNGLRDSDLFENSYVEPASVEIKFPEEKQNLIYIFMESTEMTNVSKDNGGVFDISITWRST